MGILAAVAAWALASASAGAGASGPRYSSLEEALNQGVGAYRNGAYELAIDPLQYAANRNHFLARFYLARIYSDNSTVHTDHGKAFLLYQGLADEFADIDPDDYRRTRFVAEALTAMAGYLRSGISSIGLKADPQRATRYLHHAATIFNDENAQFQLAKQIVEESLVRRGDTRDVASEKLAIHWLSVLTTERRHAGAQALLAYLMWRGEHVPLVPKDPQRAVALITIAAENSPIGDRVWIDDYFQEIYCAVAAGSRAKLDGMVASYRRQYGQPEGRPEPGRRERSALGALLPEARRTCANGEPLPEFRRSARPEGAAPERSGTLSTNLREAQQQPFARGSTAGPAPVGLIGTGATPPPAR